MQTRRLYARTCWPFCLAIQRTGELANLHLRNCIRCADAAAAARTLLTYLQCAESILGDRLAHQQHIRQQETVHVHLSVRV